MSSFLAALLHIIMHWPPEPEAEAEADPQPVPQPAPVPNILPGPHLGVGRRGTAPIPLSDDDDDNDFIIVGSSRKRQPLQPLNINSPKRPKLPAPQPQAASKSKSAHISKRAKKSKLPNESLAQKPSKTRTAHPKYTSTFDTSFYSIRILQHLIPGLGSERVFVQDLIKKKYPRYRNGVYMRGRGPYAHDQESVARQIAFTWYLLEISSHKFVLLAGGPVRDAFVQQYGEFENGDQKGIGDVRRYIWAMRHTQHTGMFARLAELRDLHRVLSGMLKQMRQVVLSMTELHGLLDFDWLDGRIKQKLVDDPKPPKKYVVRQ